MEALRATLEPGVDGSLEHGAGALIQESMMSATHQKIF